MTLNIHIYRNENFYVPNIAQTEAGFYVDVEPVRVVPIGREAALASAIAEAIAAGNKKIKTPSREQLSSPVILRHTKFKSWKQFEKKQQSWGVEETGGAWTFIPYRRRSDGKGFEEDVSCAVPLDGALSIAELAKCVARMIVDSVGSNLS
jgi:hypothetical protein